MKGAPSNGGLMYHEMQESKLCVVHCVNTVLQRAFFSELNLTALASDLDQWERQMLLEDGGEDQLADILAEGSHNVPVDSDFSIHVLQIKALEVRNLQVSPTILSLFPSNRNPRFPPPPRLRSRRARHHHCHQRRHTRPPLPPRPQRRLPHPRPCRRHRPPPPPTSTSPSSPPITPSRCITPSKGKREIALAPSLMPSPPISGSSRYSASHSLYSPPSLPSVPRLWPATSVSSPRSFAASTSGLHNTIVLADPGPGASRANLFLIRDRAAAVIFLLATSSDASRRAVLDKGSLTPISSSGGGTQFWLPTLITTVSPAPVRRKEKKSWILLGVRSLLRSITNLKKLASPNPISTSVV